MTPIHEDRSLRVKGPAGIDDTPPQEGPESGVPLTDRFLQRLFDSDRLLSPIPLVRQVIVRCGQPNVSLVDLIDLANCDPSLSAALLRTGRERRAGQSEGALSIQRAANSLGIERTRTALLGRCEVDRLTLSDGRELPAQAVWGTSSVAAIAARLVCSELGIDGGPDLASAVFMQDIGLIAMLGAGFKGYPDLIAKHAHDPAALCSAERQRYAGLDHGRAGAELARHWRLPGLVAIVCQHHHDIRGVAAEQRGPSCIANVANQIAQFILSANEPRPPRQLFAIAADWLRLSHDVVQKIVTATARASARRLNDLAKSAPDASPATVYRDARQALLQVADRANDTHEQLVTRHQHVETSSTQDPLTGLQNRRAFTRGLTRAFRQAETDGRPMSLIMVDCDHFKRINDSHGHVTGDQVLRTLASLLVRACPEQATIARFGGEEIAIILPDCDAANAFALAETLRRAVESGSFHSAEGQPIAFTISLGVATRSHTTPFSVARDLIHAADACLYTAKDRGRNQTVATPDTTASSAA